MKSYLSSFQIMHKLSFEKLTDLLVQRHNWEILWNFKLDMNHTKKPMIQNIHIFSFNIEKEFASII